MTKLLSQPIGTLAEFLAHALELELESAERYRELADSMEVHNNPEVAGLFRCQARFSEAHAAEVQELANHHALPVLSPWEFKWSCPEAPESPCMADAHYLMTRREALELALHNETRGRDFYLEVAASTLDEAVRRLASEMAVEESDHIALLRLWSQREPREIGHAAEDLDPPNVTG